MNKESTEKKPRNFKKFKYGSMSMVVIVLVIAIVVVVNLIVGYLTDRYPMKIDLTADNRYELCDETIEALKNLDTDVEIAVMYPEETLLTYNYYQMIPKILDNYKVYAEAGNGSIDVKYVDMTKDPDIVSKYSKYYNGTISEGSIVVYANEKVKVTNINSMFTTNSSSSYYQTEDQGVNFVGESEITSAILSVTDANPVRAAFASLMNGSYVYGEGSSVGYSAERFKNLLSSNGYECTDVDVMTDKITPEDYDVVIIPGTNVDFNEDTIAMLEDFLYNNGLFGKNLIYIAGQSAQLPNLDEFLEKWNIEIGEDYIFDDESAINATVSSLGGILTSPVVTVADTESVGTLPNETLPIVAPLSRQVNILNRNGDYITSAVLTSSSGSYLENADGDKVSSDGSYNVIVRSRRERMDGENIVSSNIIAIGSPFMTDPSIILNTSAYNNANVILNTVNTATGKENSIVIPQKNLQEQTLALSAAQNRVIMILVIFVIPLIVVIIGLTVLIRRRNR